MHDSLRIPLILITALGLAACGGAAPEGPAPGTTLERAAATITPADLAREIGVLADDSMAGRDTPSPELEKAASYLAGRFEAMGLEPAGEDGTYIDRFEYSISRLATEETVVRVQGHDDGPRYERDFFMVAGPAPVESEAYYVGVAGEATAPPEEAHGAILVYDHPGGELDQQWQMRMMGAVQAAVTNQAAALLIVLDPEFPGEMMGQLAQATASQPAPFPVVGITHEAARQLFASVGTDLEAVRSAGQPAGLGDAVLEIRSQRTTRSETPPNVVALLRGSDPALRDSYVVLTAHFDHVGVGAADETGDSIFNGADDDASGTAAVLEIAEAFAALDTPPARSVVFLLVSGEEKGLLGSRAWVADPTIDDVGNIVANVNMDMVGRDPLPDTVIGIGQEYTTLEGVLQRIVEQRPELGLTVILDPKPEEQYFFRSDQLPFIQQGIPAVFFTTGEHEDYHQQSDEPEAIDTDKAARVARLGFYLAWDIATAAETPEWTEEGRARVEEMLQQSPF
jgi:hypothetical protein